MFEITVLFKIFIWDVLPKEIVAWLKHIFSWTKYQRKNLFRILYE